MLYYETESSAESFLMNHTWSGARDVVKAMIEYDSKHHGNAFNTAVDLLEEFFGEQSYKEHITDIQINDYIWFQLADDLVDYGYEIWE